MMVDQLGVLQLHSWQPILNSYDTTIEIQISKVERISYLHGQTIGPKRKEHSKTKFKVNYICKI